MIAEELHGRVLGWYAEQRRDLPWRRPDRTPWGVLVSEIMLQQTPVVRVEPAWHTWMRRWPTPADLAADEPGEAIRMWGRLGYPRRALRLHAAATAIAERHGNEVPADPEVLRTLPGIGEYTAAAVASFAFGQRHVVLDTNVRRVLTRIVEGRAFPPTGLTNGERATARALLPQAAGTAATWAVASMELGALICTARTPRCGDCPVADLCRWRGLGRPEHDGPPRRGQSYAGTDRYVRGLLLAVLRGSADPVSGDRIRAEVPDGVLRDPLQRERCLDGLVTDGLVEPLDDDRYALPR